MNEQDATVFASQSGTGVSRREFGARWGHPQLFVDGYVPIPASFLYLYSRLQPKPLTAGEAMFVIHLMRFKWDREAPFPSYKRIAKEMGISDKMARTHARNLEKKGHLKRGMRIGQTNSFDLNPLFNSLLSELTRHVRQGGDEAESTPDAVDLR